MPATLEKKILKNPHPGTIFSYNMYFYIILHPPLPSQIFSDILTKLLLLLLLLLLLQYNLCCDKILKYGVFLY